MNTVVLCPAMTSHSELSDEDLKDAGISRTTVRVAVGDEDPRVLLAHFISVASMTLDNDLPDFSSSFPAPEKIDALYQKTYIDIHTRHVKAMPQMSQSLE